MSEADESKENKVQEYKDLSPAARLRVAIRYRGWFESCLRGAPLQSPIFTSAAMLVNDTILRRPQDSDDAIRFIETYNAWHTSCMEGKPLMDKEFIDAAMEVRKEFLTPDGRNANPEFG